IVSEALLALGGPDGDLLAGDIDRPDLAENMLDPDRVEQPGKRDRRLAEIDLVIANADVVIRIAIDDENVDVGRTSADLGALARSTDRSPQAGKAGTEHKNPRHAAAPDL